MPQLIVRNIEEEVVRRLRSRAAAHGISMEEEHRRLLRGFLLGDRTPFPSFGAALLSIPKAEVGEPPELFERQTDLPRPVDL